MGAATRTISTKVDSLTDTSIPVRVPAAREARNLPPAPVATKPGERKPNRKMAAGVRAETAQRADRGGKTAAQPVSLAVTRGLRPSS